MENTLENKQKFFAQYWGQNIGKIKSYHKDVKSKVSSINIEGIDFLELTALELISEEHLKELTKITCAKYFITVGCSNITLENAIESILFLRSKAYALPYNGLSVEKMIEYGWVVLKTEI